MREEVEPPALRAHDADDADDADDAGAAPALRCGSILFPGADDVPARWQEAREPPDCFHDLNLGRVVEAITAGRQEYDLAPIFHAPLGSLDAVAYRQEAMRDMEHRALRQAVAAFAERMRAMRRLLAAAKESAYELARQRWHLAAVEVYTEAVERLAHDLGGAGLAARGLRGFRDALADRARSAAFRTLKDEARSLAAALQAIRYCMLIRDGSITVCRYRGESDHGAAVAETFRKFQQGAVKDYLYKFEDRPSMNHVEAEVLERVALLEPDAFAALARFYGQHADFVDPAIVRFDREIQFYAAYLDYVDRFRGAGLPFCYPQVSDRHRQVGARDTFDLALADKLVRENGTVVCNDFTLRGPERIFVVTGPNQGGKTTFARTFGQLHHLASLGCPVPGLEARLFLYDRLLTHFEREEDIVNLRGKLEDDLVRIHRILDQATPNSILILNEIFSSTTLADALLLGREVLRRIVRLDALCVCVTFLEELAARSEETTVSMVSAVDPCDPALRTFKIERRAADGLAHALSIAEKHRVTYRWLRERLRT
ncbi:MAG TPA: DNA mismatch repair protein MutS [Thermoanaerobaculia bacterium]